MSADLIVRNAAIWRHPDATALAVQAGRVVAVGAESDVLRRAGSGTTVVDGGGASLLPGFQDAHAHPPMGGVEMLRCDVSGATSVDEVVAIIRRHVRSLADGGGCSVPAGSSTSWATASTGRCSTRSRPTGRRTS